MSRALKDLRVDNETGSISGVCPCGCMHYVTITKGEARAAALSWIEKLIPEIAQKHDKYIRLHDEYEAAQKRYRDIRKKKAESVERMVSELRSPVSVADIRKVRNILNQIIGASEEGQ